MALLIVLEIRGLLFSLRMVFNCSPVKGGQRFIKLDLNAASVCDLGYCICYIILNSTPPCSTLLFLLCSGLLSFRSKMIIS